MIKKWFNKTPNLHLQKNNQQTNPIQLTCSLDDNVSYLLKDLKIPLLEKKRFSIQQNIDGEILYVKGLVDELQIQDKILNPLMCEGEKRNSISFSPLAQLHAQNEMSVISTDLIYDLLLNGNTLLLINGINKLLSFDTTVALKRSIEEPHTESMLKNNHQGFIEVRNDNISMIRQFVDGPSLKISDSTVGHRKKCTVTILYLEDLVQPEVIKELEHRLQKVNVDTLLTLGGLEELIEDNAYSLFSQFLTTERPDTVSMHLLKGKVALLIDNSSAALIGPMNLSCFFYTIDDYNLRWNIASFIRLLRYGAFFLSFLLPSVYIAVLSFHYEVIPINLYLSVAESRERVPLPPIFEALIMEVTLETLREAGLRLPAPIGQTVGIVGGIVIGQAAVEAGLVSNIMVIVVALTAISSFILPNQDFAAGVRLLRFPFMLISSFFGMIGVMAGVMILFGHLLSLQSLGQSYGNPTYLTKINVFKDLLFRLPKTAAHIVRKNNKS